MNLCGLGPGLMDQNGTIQTGLIVTADKYLTHINQDTSGHTSSLVTDCPGMNCCLLIISNLYVKIKKEKMC